jgi:nucleotide-binding universal stress UspA family protein
VEEICRLAKEIDADLIVIGHEQNASFAKRWWGGSVGKSIVDQAPCNVFIALRRR